MYTWSTLPDDLRHVARRALEPDGDWFDDTFECHKEKSRLKGFGIGAMRFSGFWSQGDGARWLGIVNAALFLKNNAPPEPDMEHMVLEALAQGGYIPDVIISCSDSRYLHSNTMRASSDGMYVLDAEGQDFIECECIFKGADAFVLLEGVGGDAALERLVERIQKAARENADELYKALEEEYDNQCSDEYLADLCEANEYTFDEQGKLQ